MFPLLLKMQPAGSTRGENALAVRSDHVSPGLK